jgi:hypothetical protein
MSLVIEGWPCAQVDAAARQKPLVVANVLLFRAIGPIALRG